MQERRLAAIIFTDIVGYSKIMDSDEAEAIDLLKRNRLIHQTQIARYNGTLIKEIGDGILASFSLVTDAVLCALSIQENCVQENIQLRIGIHGGELVFEGRDVIGDGVNVASRLQEIAGEGEIYISEKVYSDIKNRYDIRARLIGKRKLKNLSEEIFVYRVLSGEEKKKSINTNTILSKNSAGKKTFFLATFLFITLVLVVYIVLTITGKDEFLKFRSGSAMDTGGLQKSVAILPFTSLSEEKGNEYFADGLVENLLSRLSLIDELKVISRTSSERYREKGLKTVPEIAGELGVTHIVEGSVQRDGNNARITVQLIDTKNDDHIWAGNFDCDLTDIFRTQSEITLQISSELEMFLSQEKEALIRENKTSNIKAYELYNMGRFFWNKRTGEGYRQSIEYYERAISEDPGYGLAYAGLADTYNLMAIQGHMDMIKGRNKSEEYALKALELDANLAEAYTVLGSLYDYVDWEWEKAEKAFQQALEINPNYSTAHQYYSEHLSITGQHEKARLHINRALELDPLSFVIRYVNIKILYHRGLFQEAQEQIKIAHALEKDHFFILRYEYQMYYQLGEEEKAFQTIYKIFEMPPVVHDLDSAKIIYQQSGMRGVILYSINQEMQFDDFSPYWIASEYGLIGEDNKAMDWLEKSFESEKSAEVNFNINFRNLHDNPRYITIIKKMGLR